MKSKVRHLVIIIFMVALLIGHGGQTAHAQSCDITVTNGGDSGPGTLRQAVADITPGGTICLSVDATLSTNINIDGISIISLGFYRIYNNANLVINNSTINLAAGIVNNFNYNAIIRNSTISADMFPISNYGTMLLSNSTIIGKGYPNYNYGNITIENSTFYNSSFDNTGVIAELKNSIIPAIDIPYHYISPVCPLLNINNLIIDGSCSPAFSGDPMLGPLQNNGGNTQTMALLPGSLAIDTGDPATCLSTDQRGISRPQGAACDIGAYELQVSSPTPTASPTATLTPTPGPCGTTEQCLSTVIAQNGTVIAISSTTSAAVGGYVQPYTPTPNSFTATLSSGAVLEISRTTDYGNIFTSGLIIFMSSLVMLAGMVGLVMWRK